jgi:hypothetical protein
MGAVTDEEPAHSTGFVHVRLWLALLVLGCVFELVTGFAQNQRLGWPPSLVGPVIFATVWTGLSLAQRRYNAPRSR